MADRIFTSGAEAAEAAHFPPVSKPRCSWCGKHQDQLWSGINDNRYCDTCIHAMAGVHTSKPKPVMADRIFVGFPADAQVAAKLTAQQVPASNPPKGGSGVSEKAMVQWEYQEVRFSSVRELDEFGKCGWEFFHIEAQAGGYRKALGKRLCSTQPQS